MTIEELKPLVEEGLSAEKIGLIFDKGATTIRYWLSKFNLQTKAKRGHPRNNNREAHDVTCTKCGRIYSYVPQNRQGHGSVLCNSCHVNRRRFALKAKAVEYKGGSCIDCGYNKCSTAMHFHHLDPDQKEFQIGGKHSYSWLRIKEELDKCVLLCANCHSERHHIEPPKDVLEEYTYVPSQHIRKVPAIHGNYNKYSAGCRCDKCREACSTYLKRRRARLKEDKRQLKLTLEQANEIRELYSKGGISHNQLAKQFGIAQSGVYSIIHNERYKNAPIAAVG
jgi:hypothetical protein